VQGCKVQRGCLGSCGVASASFQLSRTTLESDVPTGSKRSGTPPESLRCLRGCTRAWEDLDELLVRL
jgi:hypothetical protein